MRRVRALIGTGAVSPVRRSSKLGARLAANGIEARLFLVSGAALAPAFGRRRITRDLDAVVEPDMCGLGH
jgi:hypothetical protein